MKIAVSILLAALMISAKGDKTIYDFTVTSIEGEEVSLSQYRGKVVLIVNVASKCGYTSQYEDLQKLYEEYKDRGFVILGFPANDFMGQEPGSDEEIQSFCKKNFGVTFPMFSKISVKGDDQAELYRYLTDKSQNGVVDGKVKWNFQKYLIDQSGRPVKKFKPGVKPYDDELITELTDLLEK